MSAEERKLAWAAAQYVAGNYSFSELAQHTGLNIEQIMDAVTTDKRRKAIKPVDPNGSKLPSEPA